MTVTSSLRRVASAAVSDSTKQRLDLVRNRLVMKRIEGVNREFVAMHGLTVSGGPFEGLRYLPGLEAKQGDLIGKLLGIYESELHDAVRVWFADDQISMLVNIGCAEGYYAVGFACAMPGIRVVAYDVDPEARRLCALLAAKNGVSDRVDVRADCTPEDLAELPAVGVAVFCDCEGCELTVLDPTRVPKLTRWPVIAELHDQVHPSIVAEICRRFEPSHRVELIRSAPPAAPPDLGSISPHRRSLVLTERPVPMSWARMAPLIT